MIRNENVAGHCFEGAIEASLACTAHPPLKWARAHMEVNLPADLIQQVQKRCAVLVKPWMTKGCTSASFCLTTNDGSAAGTPRRMRPGQLLAL